MGILNVNKTRIVPLIVMVVGVVMAFYMTKVTIQHPFIGIDVEKKGDQFIVKNVSSAGWGKENAIHNGDIVLSVNEKDPNQHFSINRYNTIEQADTIQFLKNNEIKHYNIKYNGSNHYYIYHLVFPVILYLSCLIMSSFLLFRKENNGSVVLLIFFLNVFGLSLISSGASARKDLAGETLIAFGLIFSLILLLHFLESYFSNWNLVFIKKSSINLVYSIGLLVFILYVVFQNNKLVILLPPDLIFFSVTFISMNVLIIKQYLSNRATEHKQTIQILMTGLYTSFTPFVVLFAIPTLLFNHPIVRAEITTLFFISLPLSLFYLVISKEFIDMDFVIRKIYYSLLTSFVATALTLIGFLVFTQSNILDNHIEIIRLSLMIFVVFTSILYFKDKIDFLLRKWLYPKEKDYQVSLNRYLHTMKNETKIETLMKGLQKEIVVNLPISEVTLVQVREDNKIFSFFEKKEISHIMVGTMIRDKSCIGTIQKTPTGFSVPLVERDGQSLVLVAEWRKLRRKLNTAEWIWLETILNYTQIMIENLYKVEEIMKKLDDLEEGKPIPIYLSKLLLSISENERRNLARDLHDTILQDQLSLATKIDNEMTTIESPSYINILSNMRESILDQVHILREITTELHPSFLYELGFRESLFTLFEKINLNANFLFYYYIDEDIAVTKREYELTIYRIIQELLNNAIKHSKASEVHLKLFRKDRFLFLHYHDDGIGFNWNKLDQSFSTMGITGIKERVRGLNGKLYIHSAEEDGFRAEIVFDLEQYSQVN
ncbi:sensor histidine kinase [Heyndrickxia sp. NPDC080065]|uniref:sensor histidine kinase n=1 Tax=Heyndrickxia sp. NPDC080065 TaxID=3390568 RepID=UPI003D02EE7F